MNPRQTIEKLEISAQSIFTESGGLMGSWSGLNPSFICQGGRLVSIAIYAGGNPVTSSKKTTMSDMLSENGTTVCFAKTKYSDVQLEVFLFLVQRVKHRSRKTHR